MGKMLSPVLRECSPKDGPNGLQLGYRCPGCCHSHVLPVDSPSRPSWGWDGEADKPTFSPSILASAGGKTQCHHFVSEGNIQFLTDSPHHLAGKTVPMIPWTLDDADEQ